MQPPVRLSAAYVGHLLQGDRKAAVALARRCVTISASMPSHIRYVSAMVRAVRADPRTRTVKVVVVINDDGVSDQSLHEEITTITNDYGALHRRIVRDLAKARAELAKAHTVLGTGAHDLRTPLTVVLGFAEILLSDEELTPPLRFEPVDLSLAIEHVVTRHHLLRPPRGVRVVVDTTVHVCVTHDSRTAEIRVRDDGPGLPPEQLRDIFAPFHRAPSAAVVPGVGLGLTIVQQITERHGGQVHVESVQGAGATFVVRLPITHRGQTHTTS